MSDTIYCKAELNYTTAAGVVPQVVNIHNGRSRSLQWQEHGFERLDHTAAVSNWDDDSELAEHHYAEMAALAQALTGARKAIVSGHIARNPEQARIHSDYAPIEFVHSDFTDNYGDLLKQRYAQGQLLEVRALERAGVTPTELQQAEHLLILQFWRNVGDPNPDLPLAFCDAQTAPRADLHAFNVPNYADGDFAFDTFALTPGADVARHQWYTFPALTDREVIAFRTFDSRRVDGELPFWTPHSAFRDPVAGPSAPPRRSIEIRATCLL